MSFVSTLRKAREQLRAQLSDPSYIRLEAARSKIGDDGVERIATHTLFNILQVPQSTAAAGRRLAKLMRELGW